MSADDYDVGYGKPPTHTQFKQGNPGGPGRPKGSSLTRHLRAILEEEHRGVTVAEALVRIATQRALKGDYRFFKEIFDRAEGRSVERVMRTETKALEDMTDAELIAERDRLRRVYEDNGEPWPFDD